MKRSGRIKPISDRRRSEAKARAECREIVLERAHHRCQYARLLPWLPCGLLPGRRALEVDELRGGSYRSTEYLNPDACRAACPVHHDYKTNHKNEVLGLLEVLDLANPEEPE